MKRAITASEYGIEEYYPPRLRWHAKKCLEGLYGIVLKDMRSLPIVESNALALLEETYKYLSHYYIEGADDPKRRVIQMTIGRQLMQMIRANASEIEVRERPEDTRSTTLATLKAYNLVQADIERVGRELAQELEPYAYTYMHSLDLLFDLIWTSLDLTELEEQVLKTVITANTDEAMVAQSVSSALFIGAMEYFDPRKLSLLLFIREEHHDALVRGVAFAALLILGRRHQEELTTLHPDLCQQVQLMMSDNEPLLLDALKVVEVSYKTTENHQIFREKILPKLRGISSKLQQAMGGGSLSSQIEELHRGTLDKEELQEVEELMAKSSDQFAIMKDREQDTAFHMVSELKGFSFFGKMSHWFLRFDERIPELASSNVANFKSILPLMTQGERMISSDLYSFALLPVWDRASENILAELGGEQLPQFSPLPPVTELDGVKEFVFGAYRFYTLSSLAKTLINPFARSPYLLDGAFLSPLGAISEAGLLKLATLMVRFGHYSSAGRTYERVVSDYLTNTAEVWRGMSVASLMRNEDEKALYQLQKAVALEGKTMTTARKIAELLVRLGQRSKAIEWLEESEEEIEDYQLPLLRAKLLYQCGEIDKAIKAIYKANYIADGDAPGSTALLVELLLKSGKPGEALKALEREPQKEGDMLLWRAIVTFALGERKEAFTLLTHWGAKGAATNTLPEKLQLLESYGYSAEEQALIIDIIYNQA